MSEEKNTVELKDEELSKVAGGATTGQFSNLKFETYTTIQTYSYYIGLEPQFITLAGNYNVGGIYFYNFNTNGTCSYSKFTLSIRQDGTFTVSDKSSKIEKCDVSFIKNCFPTKLTF